MYRNIFDTHAHYTDSSFDEDRDALINKIHSEGVEYIMLSVSDIPDSLKALEISRKYPYMFCACGVHPECIDTVDANYIEQIRKTVRSAPEKVKAVGEIGLDYHYENYDRKKMMNIFSDQIDLANELKLPVIIHSRDATADTLDILRAHTPFRGVVHCFSGSAQTARELLDLGLYISFTGVLTFKNARKSIEALEVIPTDRLMLETDCPYMAPVPWRGQRCDSSMISSIAEKAAEVKKTTAQEILDITCANALKFFDIK